MPKYLLHAKFSAQGAAGVLKEGGTARRETVRSTIEGLGGTLDAFYFAFGDTDVYLIVDAPDNATIAALSLTVSASGAVGTTTTVLVTPEEVDEAKGKTVDYQPPGG